MYDCGCAADAPIHTCEFTAPWEEEDDAVDSDYSGPDGEATPETADCECCEELSDYNVNMPASNCGEDE